MSNARNLANLLGTSTTITQDKISSDVSLGGGVTTYDNISTLPLSGNDIGDQAFVDSDNRLYIWNGSGWYNIALINTSPSITGGYQDGYLFEIDGTPIEITLVGSDPEGIPLTWSYEVTSGSLTNGGGTTATVSNVDNVFTITPSTNKAYVGSFSLTFKASDGVNIATAVSSFTLAFSIPNSKYTTLLAKGIASTQNSTFIDSSTNNHTITANGDVYQGTFSPYRAGGYSMYFDGSGGDYYYAAASSDFDMDVNEWCIECWVYVTDLSADRGIAATWQTGGQFGLEIKYTGAVSMDIRERTTTASASGVITENQWYHIAVVRDNSGSSDVVTIYVDGVDVANQSFTSGSDFIYYNGLLKDLRIGVHFDGSTPFEGYISNFRYLIGDAVYRSSFTPPTEPLEDITGTKLLTANRPYVVDTSSYARTINVTGTPFIKLGGPFDYRKYDPATNGGSAYFGGTDYVSYTEPTIAVGQDFCFEFWINFTSTVAISNGEIRAFGSSPNDPLLYFSTDGTTISSVEFYMNNSSVFNLSNTFSLNTWYHIAVSRSSGEVSLFINGKLKGTNTNTNSIGGGTYFVGSHPTANWGITGYMSDYRSVIGSPVYTTDFTPPTAPLTEITNTSALLKFTNAGIQDYSQVSDLKTVGNATGSNTQTKYAAYSMYFDGTGDYLSATASEFAFGTGDFTIEAWVYMTAYTGSIAGGSIFGTVISSQSGYSLNTGENSTSLRLISNASGAWSDTLTTGSGLSLNTWTHIAMSRNGANLRIFKDGVVIGSTSSASTWNFTGTTGWTGRFYDGANDRYFTGYIEDLRITKGLARYTANFTPPTTELLG